MRVVRALAVGAALLALSSCGAGDGDEIYIGLAAPVSIPFGEALVNGAMLAIDEINADRGINGRQLVLDIKDDEKGRERAIEGAGEFREEGKGSAGIGRVTAGAAIAAADIHSHPERGGPAGART